MPENIFFFGWFLNETTASSLERVTKLYFEQAISEIPEVESFMQHLTSPLNITDPSLYFTKPLDPNTNDPDPFFHITAMFCGAENIDCSDYYEKAKDFLDTTFETNLIGLFFTERTFGIRVLLTESQEELFDRDEEMLAVKLLGESRAQEANYPGIEFQSQKEDFHPTSSGAHITLGCAPGIPAVETGPDLLEIVENEISLNETYYKDFMLEGIGTLRQYGDGQSESISFVFYPKNKMVVTGTFQAYFSTPNSAIPVSVLPISSMLLLSFCIPLTF
jgi:2',3'-cyclic-nucleotide 3'-phosphodiesterase